VSRVLSAVVSATLQFVHVCNPVGIDSTTSDYKDVWKIRPVDSGIQSAHRLSSRVDDTACWWVRSTPSR